MKKIVIIIVLVASLQELVIAQVVPQGFLMYSPSPETVVIGSQIWMKRNLDVATYRNGTPIEGANSAFTRTVTTPAWCYYNYAIANKATYGKLYNGYAVNDSRGICPIGFRVPTRTDFEILAATIGGNANGGDLKETGTANWYTPNANATNTTNFSALPGGYMGDAGSSSAMFLRGHFWTSTSAGSTNYIRYLSYNDGNFVESTGFLIAGGISVRCIKE